jgi:4-amino-4-deoxy-L-arabinose transferase-like glycosyltransferase
MVFVVYWIARELTRRTSVGMLAALLYAVWIGAIVTSARPVPDTWAGFFIISSVGAFVWARERPDDLRRLVPLGLLVGVGIYFRPFVVLLPVALGIAGVPRGGWRKRLLWSAVPTAIALVILSPWTIRNYVEFHRFIPTRTGLGQAVFEGAGGAPTDQAASQVVRQKDRNARYGTPRYDDFLLRAAWRRIADDPGLYARSVLRRAKYLLPCLLLLFVWRRWRGAALLLVSVAVTIIGPYLLIGDDTRFYLPAAFTYLILTAMTVVVVFSQLGRLITRTARSSSRSGAESR